MQTQSDQDTQFTESRHTVRREKLVYEVWKEAPVSRGYLARKLRLNLPTISHLVSDLLTDGILTEQGYAGSTGGRKPQLLDVDPARGSVIGITFSSRGISSAWADLRGNLQNLKIYPFSPADGKDRALAALFQAVQDQIDHHARSSAAPIVQIGAGVSGLLESSTGVSKAFPRFDDWVDVPLQDMLQQKFQLPVVTDSHVAAIALAECLFGNHHGFKNALYVQLGPGLGLGIIIEGQVYRGSRLSVGEFGHTTLSEDGGPICYCGNYGCLESLASDYALVQQAESAMREGVKTRIQEFVTGNGNGKITPGAVFRAAAEGDRFATNLVERVARLLGTGIANLVNLFSPELIILGGTMSEAGDVLLKPLCHTVEARAMDRQDKDVKIVTASFGKEEAIRGAITLALNRYFAKSLQD